VAVKIIDMLSEEVLVAERVYGAFQLSKEGRP